LALAKAREEEARIVWTARKGDNGTLDAWTAAIGRTLEVEQAIHNLRAIQTRHFGTVGA
jgi:hypothetical protein